MTQCGLEFTWEKDCFRSWIADNKGWLKDPMIHWRTPSLSARSAIHEEYAHRETAANRARQMFNRYTATFCYLDLLKTVIRTQSYDQWLGVPLCSHPSWTSSFSF